MLLVLQGYALSFLFVLVIMSVSPGLFDSCLWELLLGVLFIKFYVLFLKFRTNLLYHNPFIYLLFASTLKLSSVAPLSSGHQFFPASGPFPMSSSHQVVLELQLQHQSFQYSWLISFRIDWFFSLLSKGLSEVFSSTTV